MKLQIPYYKQTSEMNCGPTALKMALEFLGEKHSVPELEEKAEIKQGKAVSTLKLAVASAKLGFKVEFYSKFLGLNPDNLKMDFYQKHADITQQEEAAKLLEQAESLGIKLYEKTFTLEEIINNIKENKAIIIILDWNAVRGISGYRGHFVPVVGYDNENIYVHHQGFIDPRAFFPIKRALFDRARKSAGTDEDIVIIYKK